ncbi:MAG TPA: LacI family DNA-binding transcriptional regulator [Lacunisphaera sp.]|nr:LacI family DNA-binding transcriptional regulator [Lacunisphaera sp.]
MPSRSRRSKLDKTGIVQIAATLGVSPSTVSRALRPETAHLVRAESRKKIMDLAEKQHFSPNAGARMLRKGVNATLTVVVPLDENIFFSEYYGRFLAGTLHAAAARGWGVHICTLRRKETGTFREAMQHLSLDSSGIIYLAEPLSSRDLEELRGYRRPFVLTKSTLPEHVDVRELGVPVVGVDNLAGARSVASLLLQLGHQRIGLLLGPSGSRDAQERKQGYLDMLQKAGVVPRPEWIHSGPFSAETGRTGIKRFLECAEKPTAICCANDEIAFGAITAAHLVGVRCPDDISIVGFDDGIWATACQPALTTIRQPLADLAERAVGLIVEAATSPAPSRRIHLDDMSAPMMIRESTRPLRATERK